MHDHIIYDTMDYIREGIILRIFKNVKFERFARKENISDKTLIDTVKRIENGLIDADLGNGVIKQRIARERQGIYTEVSQNGAQNIQE